MAKVLYKPRGIDAQYAELACNPVLSCRFCCWFCYNALKFGTKFWREKPVFNMGSPRAFLKALEKDCKEWNRRNKPRVHFGFSGDCLQDGVKSVTAEAIGILHKYGFSVQILTKGSWEGIDRLLTPNDRFGVSMVSMSLQGDGGVHVDYRLEMLKEAQQRGIPIFVAIEPVVDINDAQNVIKAIVREGIKPNPVLIGPMRYYKMKYRWHEIKKAIVDMKSGLEIRFRDYKKNGG